MTTDPLDLPATPERLRLLARSGILTSAELSDALAMGVSTPSRAWWERFLSLALMGLGSLLGLAGVIYFFAFNWGALGRFEKLGLLAGAIVLSALAAWRLGAGLGGQTALLFAATLVGPLLAVYGQIYQTGADPSALFLTWAGLIAPWVLLARFAPSWLLLLVVADIALHLFVLERVVTQPESISRSALQLGVLNGGAWFLAEWFGLRRGLSWLQRRWFPRVLALMATLPLWFLAEVWAFSAPAKGDPLIGGALLIALCGLTYYVHRAWRTEVFYVALISFFAIAIVTSLLTSVLILRSPFSDFWVLLSALCIGGLVILGAVGAVAWIRLEMRARVSRES